MRRPALKAVGDAPEPLSNCEDQRAAAMLKQAEATMEQARAMHRIADAGEHFVATFGPAAKAITDLGAAQQKLCAFLVKNRLKLAGGILSALVGVGALAPNVATALGNALKAAGLG